MEVVIMKEFFISCRLDWWRRRFLHRSRTDERILA